MFSILYNIIVAPIELIVEFVFELMFRVLGQRETNQGLAVIGVSLAISFLTLPLYRMADKVQQKERDTQKQLSKWVNHIKKTFKGDERFMMLQTYYKENGYSPIQALNGSLALLLEIPFFIAAYHFLSNLEVLNGAAFGPFSDLGAPDRLFSIGKFDINVLPITMTLINCISSAIYLKGFPIRDKIQTYGMALIFLILLYNSPSGLVVYWTCNNIFSLVKNIFYKLKNPRKVFDILAASCGTLFTAVVIFSGILNSKKKIIAVLLFMLLTYLPIICSLLNKKKAGRKEINFFKNFDLEKKNLVIISLFISILVGAVIPSSVIASSPAEFVDITDYQNPLLFVLSSLCYSIGFFSFWFIIIFNILSEKGKKILYCLTCSISFVFIMNFLFFGKKLGILSPFLAYESGYSIANKEILLNLLIDFIVLLIVIFVLLKFKIKYLFHIYLVLFISLFGLSIKNICNTQKMLNDMAYIKNNDVEHYKNKKIIPLSTKGKNVIVFMLDRAISGYIPYFLEEKPQLKEQFSGFTYYPNTLSFGGNTIQGSIALFGGYEYSIAELNKRTDVSLVDKHSEALKLLPLIFENEGYEVTVCDPPLAGYKWIPDLSIFDDISNINTYITMGVYKNEKLKGITSAREQLNSNKRNLFCYSLTKVFPFLISKVLYDEGHYYDSKYKEEVNNASYNSYSVLSLLKDITEIVDNDKSTYLAIDNDTAHEPCIYQLPDYDFAFEGADNTDYNTAADGKIPMENNIQISHYHSNMAALLQLGSWFDWMKENNVYDNTRIIIAADHGRELNQFENLYLKKLNTNIEWYNPLLMVKDFNAKKFSISNEFMTNADVPTLATKDIIKNPTNPFTGNPINSDEKNKHPQKVVTINWDLEDRYNMTLNMKDAKILTVHDNIFDEKNWERIQ